MLAWLLALAVALTPVVPAFAQEDGGESSESSDGQDGGESSGEESGMPNQPGANDAQADGDQPAEDGGESSGGESGGDNPPPGEEPASESGGSGDSGESGVNIVGDIAADDGADEAAPKARKPAVRKAKVSKKKAPPPAIRAAKGRLSRRRRGAAGANPVGTPVAPTAEAEPQFPELDLPDLKEAVAKKEPPPPTAPLVPLPLAFP